jgi:CBS domain-containing protein
VQPQVSESAGAARVGRTVSEVMRPAVTTIEPFAHLAAAAYLMNHADQSALVVVDTSDRPTAIITESDLLRAVARGTDTGQSLIVDWMNRDPETVHPDMPVTEAAQIMVSTGRRHLPVVVEHRVVGIVAITDVVDALVNSMRLASVVVYVSDLGRALAFYQPLLRYAVTVSDVDAALLVGPNGSQLYLHEVTGGLAHDHDMIGLQLVAWTAGSADELDRCEELLRERGAYERRDTSEGFARVEGRDPDGLPVLITYPGPERSPRHMISPRIYRS